MVGSWRFALVLFGYSGLELNVLPWYRSFGVMNVEIPISMRSLNVSVHNYST